MGIREGKWRCPYCSVVNRGADLACKGCGATRDKDVTFFLEDEAPEVTEAELLRKAEAGADWLCQFCQTSNRPGQPHCVQCGAEKGTSPSRPVRDVRPPPPPGPAMAPPTPSRGRLGCALILLLVTGFCAVWAYRAFRKTDETVAVTGFEWTRTIEVEAYRTLRESAWEGEVPAGARPVSHSREVHHTEQERVGSKRVKVGTKDLGNGFFKDVYEDQPVYRDRPVYRMRIGYEIDRWVADRKARASGHDQNPRWPETSLGRSERAGPRSESYVVLLRGRTDYRLELPESRWAALHEGQKAEAVIQGGRRVLEIR